MDNQDNTQVNNTMDSTQQNTQPVENQQVASQPLDQPQADNSASADDPKESKSPKSDNKLMFLIIGAVLVLVVILVLIIFSGSRGFTKLGQPVPESNLSVEENKGSPETIST